MPLARVSTVFTGVAGSPAYNSLYFLTGAPGNYDGLVEAVTDFWAGLLEFSDDACIATIQGDVEVIDEATGQIIAVEAATSGTTGGQNTGALLPPATQGLLRLRTGSYEGGRQVQGRVFIPYLTTGAGNAGPSGPTITDWLFAASTLKTASDAASFEWSVWSRVNGLSRTIQSYSVWTQYAVQRSRRD